MCLPVHTESMQTFEAEHPCFTSVLAHVLGLCTFKFVLKMNVCAKTLINSCIYGLSATVRHNLNSEETVRAVQMIEDGFSQRRVARTLCMSARQLETDFTIIQYMPNALPQAPF